MNHRTWPAAMLIIATVHVLSACEAAKPPPRYEVVHLHGTPYQRGLEHGQKLSAKVHSFYTRMLSVSLLPYLNRLQTDIASVLTRYRQPEYANGQFSLRLLRESAHELEKSIPAEYLEEMHGIADGASQGGMPISYEDVLVLNTFLDTTMAARAITFFLQAVQAPVLMHIGVTGAGADGADNDDDGKTDEAGEGSLNFAADTTATLVEVATDAALVLRLADDDGVDPATVRVLINGHVYSHGHPALHIEPWPYKSGPSTTELRVTWTPPTPAQVSKDWLPLPPAAAVAFLVQCSDLKIAEQPLPAHPHAMRPQQFTIGTRGLGKARWQVVNRGVSDGNSQPPSHGFALRNSATLDGSPLLAHHFSLLDAGVAHDHAIVQIHHPAAGGQAFAVIGWAGMVYGMSGMNEAGLAIAVDHSDTLNNPLTDHFRKELFAAHLTSAGTPMGIALRQVMEKSTTANAGYLKLAAIPHTFGWNVLMVDAAKAIVAVELHSDILGTSPALAYTPNGQIGDLDSHGRPWASFGPDDLTIAAHFRRQADDLELSVGFDLRPQRFWSSYFFPSVRAMVDTYQAIASGYGKFNVERAIAVLRLPQIVDRNDSMTAVVFEPALRRFHVALGTVPATDSPFDVVTFAESK